jgi:hypothetical protein
LAPIFFDARTGRQDPTLGSTGSRRFWRGSRLAALPESNSVPLEKSKKGKLRDGEHTGGKTAGATTGGRRSTLKWTGGYRPEGLTPPPFSAPVATALGEQGI